MSDSLARDLREFIQEAFLFGMDTSFSDQDSLMENGIVDSTGVLELIAHLESTYGITIDDHELVPENLDSIANLVRFLNSKEVGATTDNATCAASPGLEVGPPSRGGR